MFELLQLTRETKIFYNTQDYGGSKHRSDNKRTKHND